jgi:hypothetical protein
MIEWPSPRSPRWVAEEIWNMRIYSWLTIPGGGNGIGLESAFGSREIGTRYQAFAIRFYFLFSEIP